MPKKPMRSQRTQFQNRSQNLLIKGKVVKVINSHLIDSLMIKKKVIKTVKARKEVSKMAPKKYSRRRSI